MPTKNRRRRKNVTYINLRIAEDDLDLVEWWSSLPAGVGSEQVKRAIRQYIANASDPTPATRGDLGEAVHWVVSELGQREQAQTEALARAIAALNEQVKRLLAGGAIAAAAATPDNAQPALSDAEQRARLKKVVNQKW